MDREQRIRSLANVGDPLLRQMLAGNEEKRTQLERALRQLGVTKSIYEEALARLDGSAAKETPGAGSEPST